MRVGTWNVREGVPDPAEIVRLVREHGVDVLALRGVDFDAEGRSDVLAALTGGTPLSEVRTLPLSDATHRPGRLAGVAVASVYPVEHAIACVLPNPGLTATRGGRRETSHDKGLLSCVVNLGERSVVVASLDMLPFGRFGAAAEQPRFAEVWHELAYHLAALDLLPMVLAGAFHTARRDLIQHSRFKSTISDDSGVDIMHSTGLSAAAGPTAVPTPDGHTFYVVELSPEP